MPLPHLPAIFVPLSTQGHRRWKTSEPHATSVSQPSQHRFTHLSEACSFPKLNRCAASDLALTALADRQLRCHASSGNSSRPPRSENRGGFEGSSALEKACPTRMPCRLVTHPLTHQHHHKPAIGLCKKRKGKQMT